MPRVSMGVHGALRVLGVPPDLTVGIDMSRPSHLTSERVLPGNVRPLLDGLRSRSFGRARLLGCRC